VIAGRRLDRYPPYWLPIYAQAALGLELAGAELLALCMIPASAFFLLP
jgi:hypothetical protein